MPTAWPAKTVLKLIFLRPRQCGRNYRRWSYREKDHNPGQRREADRPSWSRLSHERNWHWCHVPEHCRNRFVFAKLGSGNALETVCWFLHFLWKSRSRSRDLRFFPDYAPWGVGELGWLDLWISPFQPPPRVELT
jgi:hypothetical protein